MSRGWKDVVDMTDLLDSPEPIRRGPNQGRGQATNVMVPATQVDLLDYPSTPHRSSRTHTNGINAPPLRPSSRPNNPSSMLDSPSSQPLSSYLSNVDTSFGSSILKSKPSKQPKASSSSSRTAYLPRMDEYIKPGKGAFKNNTSSTDSPFSQRAHADSYGYDESGWPTWAKTSAPTTAAPSQSSSKTSTRPTSVSDDDDSGSSKEEGEDFDLANVQYTAQDFERHGDAEEQMRELLAGAVGDGEDDHGGEGDDTVEGFAKDMKLMPHQVRGVRWMRERETGRKRGGILADVSRSFGIADNRTWVLARLCRRWRVSSRESQPWATSACTRVVHCKRGSVWNVTDASESSARLP